MSCAGSGEWTLVDDESPLSPPDTAAAAAAAVAAAVAADVAVADDHGNASLACTSASLLSSSSSSSSSSAWCPSSDAVTRPASPAKLHFTTDATSPSPSLTQTQIQQQPASASLPHDVSPTPSLSLTLSPSPLSLSSSITVSTSTSTSTSPPSASSSSPTCSSPSSHKLSCLLDIISSQQRLIEQLHAEIQCLYAVREVLNTVNAPLSSSSTASHHSTTTPSTTPSTVLTTSTIVTDETIDDSELATITAHAAPTLAPPFVPSLSMHTNASNDSMHCLPSQLTSTSTAATTTSLANPIECRSDNEDHNKNEDEKKNENERHDDVQAMEANEAEKRQQAKKQEGESQTHQRATVLWFDLIGLILSFLFLCMYGDGVKWMAAGFLAYVLCTSRNSFRSPSHPSSPTPLHVQPDHLLTQPQLGILNDRYGDLVVESIPLLLNNLDRHADDEQAVTLLLHHLNGEARMGGDDVALRNPHSEFILQQSQSSLPIFFRLLQKYHRNSKIVTLILSVLRKGARNDKVRKALSSSSQDNAVILIMTAIQEHIEDAATVRQGLLALYNVLFSTNLKFSQHTSAWLQLLERALAAPHAAHVCDCIAPSLCRLMSDPQTLHYLLHHSSVPRLLTELLLKSINTTAGDPRPNPQHVLRVLTSLYQD